MARYRLIVILPLLTLGGCCVNTMATMDKAQSTQNQKTVQENNGIQIGRTDVIPFRAGTPAAPSKKSLGDQEANYSGIAGSLLGESCAGRRDEVSWARFTVPGEKSRKGPCVRFGETGGFQRARKEYGTASSLSDACREKRGFISRRDRWQGATQQSWPWWILQKNQ